MNRRRFLRDSLRMAEGAAFSTYASSSKVAGAKTSAWRFREEGSSPAVAKGPLRILNSNPRFFTDGDLPPIVVPLSKLVRAPLPPGAAERNPGRRSLRCERDLIMLT